MRATILLLLAYIFTTCGQRLYPQASDSIFNYEYSEDIQLYPLKEEGCYPLELEEVKRNFLTKSEENYSILVPAISHLRNIYNEGFINWINENHAGIPLWNKAVVFTNRMKNYYVIKTPMVLQNQGKLEGVLYLQWNGEKILDGYYAKRNEILKNVIAGEPVEKYPDVFRILDIAAWELDLFCRHDISYGYAFFPTKSGFEEFPDAHPAIPILACFDLDGYRFLNPSSGLFAKKFTCCSGYFFSEEFSRNSYPQLPFLE